MSDCAHENQWSARNLCAEHCGSMHTYCNDCGERTDNHTHAPVDIPLPPEPPRTRVIEALDADGVVQVTWTYFDGAWHWDVGAADAPWGFMFICNYAMDPRNNYTLRHRAAETEETRDV